MRPNTKALLCHPFLRPLPPGSAQGVPGNAAASGAAGGVKLSVPVFRPSAPIATPQQDVLEVTILLEEMLTRRTRPYYVAGQLSISIMSGNGTAGEGRRPL